jgi:hypothetical protein
MKVAHCLRKTFGKVSRLNSTQVNSLQHIIEKHDLFYKSLKELCKNNRIKLSEPLPKGVKQFHYYLKPEIVKGKKSENTVTDFDVLMVTHSIVIQAKTSFEARILGFILSTIINDTYDFYNDKLLSGADDSFLMSQISSMNEPQGLFKNKPTIKSTTGKDESIVYNSHNIGKLLDEPIHLLFKRDSLQDYLFR